MEDENRIIPQYAIDFAGIIGYNFEQNSISQEVRYGLIRDADAGSGAGAADFCSARWLCYEENRQRQGLFLPSLDRK